MEGRKPLSRPGGADAAGPVDLDALGSLWRRMRPARRLVHLDSAAAGRSSWAVLDAVAAHLRSEAEVGAYVAATDVAPVLDRARRHILDLLGWARGTVAFMHSAEDALRQILLCWPGGRPATVLHPRGEYGPNVAVFRQCGVAGTELGGPHRVAAAELATALGAGPPDFVHLTWLGSHIGTVQPVADLATVCAAAGVPVVVDAAQAFGHLDTTLAADVGADIVYGTSRKWLAGPRGVGFIAVRGEFADRFRPLEQSEATFAGRLGFATALAEHVELGPARVHAGLAAIGVRTRHQLAELPGWQVVEDLDEPSATVTLRGPGDVDLAGVRARLLSGGMLADKILTTFLGTERSPAEMARPALRISGHLDTTAQDVAKLADALRTLR